MLSVTDRAKEELKKLTDKKVDYPGAGLRLIASDQGNFCLRIDAEAPGDRVVKHEGLIVLLVERRLDDGLREHTLAFENDEFIIAKGPLSGFNKNTVTLD
jgi:hypothetical protein